MLSDKAVSETGGADVPEIQVGRPANMCFIRRHHHGTVTRLLATNSSTGVPWWPPHLPTHRQLARKTGKAFQKGATCPHAEVG